MTTGPAETTTNTNTPRLRSIFTTIETPRLAVYAERQRTRPIQFTMTFVALTLIWTAVLSFAGIDVVQRDMPVVQLINVSVIPLIFGVCLYPLRWILVPVTTFVICYFTGLAIEAVLIEGQTTGWELAAIGLGTNLVAGLFSGLLGKLTFHLASRSALSAGMDSLAGAAMSMSYGVLGVVVAYPVLNILIPDTLGQPGHYGWIELFFRSIRLGLLSGGAFIVFLDFPDRRHIRETIFFAPLFILLGYLSNAGMALHNVIDMIVLCLIILLARPIYPAIAACLTGICLFSAMTGSFVEQVFLDTPAALRDECLITVMFCTAFLLGTSRVLAAGNLARQSETLGRIARAQEISRFGYFVAEVDPNTVKFDPVAQRILGVPPQVPLEDLLNRVHPDDRGHISTVENAVRADTSLSLRFARQALWDDEAEHQIILLFMRFETLWDSRKIFYGMIADVTDEHAQEMHLRRVLAELSDRQSRQTQLFSIISHELRTPASTLSMIIDEMDEGAQWKDLGPQMHAVMEQMLSVLGDMRQTVRPEQNLPVNPEVFRAQDLAENVRNALQMMAKAKGVILDLRMAPEATEARVADRTRLNQALLNLVKNALVHSRATIVTIAYQEKQGEDGTVMAHWRVWDNGQNIPAAFRDRLFEPFTRAERTTARTDGSGLGLFIARSAMRLLGGDVVYVHRSNSGAEFQITLPLRLPTMLPSAPATVPFSNVQRVDLGKRTVLLVEDSQMMGNLMVARLERVFDKVIWVQSGMQAIPAILQSSPDVILTDLFMPGMGGDQLARTLRSQGSAIPIIGMTAAEVGDEIERFRNAGADEVMTKPIRMDQLMAVLGRLIPPAEGSDLPVLVD